MLVPEYSQYVGRMKQPLQKPDIDNPTMYAVADSRRAELDLILMTPGSFLHAYNFIKQFGAKSVRLFVPSLRPEFISDIFNLYMILKDVIPIKWVFPKEYRHYDFTKGQIKEETYVNTVNPQLTISYIENSEVSNLYDIVVRTKNGTHYFSFHLTEKRLLELFKNRTCTYIHLPKSSTLYGGLTYDEALKIDRKYKRKLEPHDFTSVEELYKFKGRPIPDGKEINKFDDDPQTETDPLPEDYDGDMAEDDIMKMFEDDTSEGGKD